MKKLFLMLFLATAAVSVKAQNLQDINDGSSYYFYCGITAVTDANGKVRIELDWDKENNREQLRDESSNKIIEFNSVAGILNYMSQRGWELCQACGDANKQLLILRKRASSEADAKTGLMFKSDFKSGQ